MAPHFAGTIHLHTSRFCRLCPGAAHLCRQICRDPYIDTDLQRLQSKATLRTPAAELAVNSACPPEMSSIFRFLSTSTTRICRSVCCPTLIDMLRFGHQMHHPGAMGSQNAPHEPVLGAFCCKHLWKAKAVMLAEGLSGLVCCRDGEPRGCAQCLYSMTLRQLYVTVPGRKRQGPCL